jgi:hypothetical protein
MVDRSVRCHHRDMSKGDRGRTRRGVAIAVALAASLFAGSSVAPGATPVAHAHSCSPGFAHAALSWGHKCLRAGQFCKVKGDRQYHRYGFHCHTGARLARTATPNNGGSGCQPGYSPCLPRVADLNCADIPASKRPVRVTGSDPYRLDGDGDGVACGL